jgi:putative membrane protein
MMWGYGWSWPGMLMMTLGSLLWIALIAVLIWAVVRWLNKQNIHTTTPSAMEMLRQRYARGEIDTATFEQMRERLLNSITSETPEMYNRHEVGSHLKGTGYD